MMKYRSAQIRSHRVSRRLAGLLPVVLLVPVMLISVGSAPAAVASTLGTVVGPACPDVMVIAARGSGEQPQPVNPAYSGPYHGDWTTPSAFTFTDTAYGAGEANFDVYMTLSLARPDLKFSLDPVQYPADQAMEAFTGIAAFHASEKSAVTTILDDVDRTERICGGGVKYVFTGYSQGAWAVHEALWQLASRKPSIMGKVVGVSLFGDPEFVPGQRIVRDFTVQTRLWSGAATVVDPTNEDVPKTLRSVTGSYCLPNDPICQAVNGLMNLPAFTACQLVNWAAGLCPHTSYLAWGETAKAAAFLAPNLPSKTVWPHLTLSAPPRGTVGAAYSWTATVAPKPTAKKTYTWTASDPQALPLGLKFSSSGVLSGIPTQAGTYGFQIQATTPQGRYVSGTVSVRINPGSSALTVTTTTLPAAVVTQPYTATLTATGGAAPLTWSIASGSLPPGLSLSTAGSLSGTPSALGSTGFTVAVHDSTGATATAPLTLLVGGPGAIRAGSISAGYNHTCAVTTTGAVKCWGDNPYGELGDGTTTSSTTPVDVVGLGSGVAAVSAGGGHTCAVTTAGGVKCWGDNGYGELGDGTTTSSTTPVDVVGLGSGVAAVSAGDDHTCAVTTAGGVKCWGDNIYGALGDGTTTSSTTPVDVVGLGSGVAAVSAGAGDSCAVTTAGAGKCWGDNFYGELGDGTTTSSTTPVDVVGLP
jgi:Cutinase/Regulator of chromosome condensation (RCC1) repeat/Putative Ig domain